LASVLQFLKHFHKEEELNGPWQVYIQEHVSLHGVRNLEGIFFQ
jgi:hypothetical protein